MWVFFLVLSLFSILAIYSSSSWFTNHKQEVFPSIMKGQLGLVSAGIFLCWLVHIFGTQWLRFFFFCTPVLWLVLGYTLVSSVINGSARWLHIGSLSIQPSEIAKSMIVFIIATLLDLMRKDMKNAKRYFFTILIVTVCYIGLVVSENLSTALLMFLVVLGMMFFARVPYLLKWIVAPIVIAVFIGGGILYALPDSQETVVENTALKRATTWRNRVTRFFEPLPERPEDYKITDTNRQVTYAHVAFASSGGWGVGPGNSVQREYLTHAYSDFIFAFIAEEYGFIGCIVVLLIYLALFFRIGRIASYCTRPFDSFVVLGLGLLIVSQAFVNMAVAVDLIPVTGQPLPLVAHGGSSFFMLSFDFGVILAISHRAQIAKKKKKGTQRIAKSKKLVSQQNAESTAHTE